MNAQNQGERMMAIYLPANEKNSGRASYKKLMEAFQKLGMRPGLDGGFTDPFGERRYFRVMEMGPEVLERLEKLFAELTCPQPCGGVMRTYSRPDGSTGVQCEVCGNGGGKSIK